MIAQKASVGFAAWCGLGVAAAVYEWREIRRGDAGVTLTRVIRSAFRTDTPAGALAFRLTVRWGSDWLVRHIIEGAKSLEVKTTCGIRAE